MKANLIRRVKFGVFDDVTQRLLVMFCSRIRTVEIYNAVLRSHEAFPSGWSREAKKRLEAQITLRIDNFVHIRGTQNYNPTEYAYELWFGQADKQRENRSCIGSFDFEELREQLSSFAAPQANKLAFYEQLERAPCKRPVILYSGNEQTADLIVAKDFS
jgi:hypothetical protein